MRGRPPLFLTRCRASAAGVALLSAFASNPLMAATCSNTVTLGGAEYCDKADTSLPDTIPTSCTFINPNGWHCTWDGTTYYDLYPQTTPTPGPTTAAPTAAPTTAPTASPTPSPTPASTVCDTDISETTSSGVDLTKQLNFNLVGKGLLALPKDLPALECGDGSGHIVPCPVSVKGPVTVNCILTGYDPPPLIRPQVVINESIDIKQPFPFIRLPAAGAGDFYAGIGTSTLTGGCTPPRPDDTSTTLVGGNASPIKCEVPKRTYAPTDVLTQPVPTQCPQGTICPEPYPPPGGANFCSSASKSTAMGTVPNLGTGCTSTTVSGLSKPVEYCHTDISSIPQECSSGTCSGSIPGFKCGGAIPLLDPIPVTAAIPQCPPDNWCIDKTSSHHPNNGGSLAADGAIHISQGTGDTSLYNITIVMADNRAYLGTNSRTVNLPPMGACNLSSASSSASGIVVLSSAFPYLVTPASIQLSGVNCYGVNLQENGSTGATCNYASTTPWSPAPYAVHYNTAYKPYGAIYSLTPAVYADSDGEGAMTLPYIDLPGGTQLLLSLAVNGSVTLPEGGTVVTQSGGFINIPKGKTISAEQASSTSVAAIKLPAGVTYSADGSSIKTTSSDCYIQVIPSGMGPTQTDCLSSVPPTAAVIDPAESPNPALTITTTAVQVPNQTPLPPFTKIDEPDPCASPPSNVTLKGATVEPSVCPYPSVYDITMMKCVTPKPNCGTASGTSFVPWPAAVPPSPAAFPTGGGYCNIKNYKWEPTTCDVSGYIWCHDTQTCVNSGATAIPTSIADPDNPSSTITITSSTPDTLVVSKVVNEDGSVTETTLGDLKANAAKAASDVLAACHSQTAQPLPPGNWVTVCHTATATISGTMLTASCLAMDGVTWKTTTFDISPCDYVGDADGSLACGAALPNTPVLP